MGIVFFSTNEKLNDRLKDIVVDGVNISEYQKVRDAADDEFEKVKTDNIEQEANNFQKAADDLVQAMQKLNNKAKSSGIEGTEKLDPLLSAVENQLAYIYIGYLSSFGRLSNENVKKKISGLKEFMDKYPG